MKFQFADFADFLAMNGHGLYVWIAYAATFLALVGLMAYPALRRRFLRREMLRQQRIQQRRQEKRKGAVGPA